MTIAELKDLIADLPDHYEVVLGQPESEAMPAGTHSVGHFQGFTFDMPTVLFPANALALWPSH